MSHIKICNIISAIGFSLILSGCGSAESDARKAVLGSLKDPDSAKFGKFSQANEESACLTVNARNAMGGYTGDQQATLIKLDNEWIVMDITKGSHDICIKSTREVLEKEGGVSRAIYGK